MTSFKSLSESLTKKDIDADVVVMASGIAESDSYEGDVDLYMGEVEQVYETQTQYAIERDEDGEPVYEPVYVTDPVTGEIEYEPVYDLDTGEQIYTEEIVLDEYGDPVMVEAEDADGNTILVPKMEQTAVMQPVIAVDGQGEQMYQTIPLYVDEPVLDEHGDPVLEPMTDEDGNIVYDEDGDPVLIPVTQTVRATETVYVTDSDGEPVPETDEEGNYIYDKVQLVDADGEPIVEYDEDGWPVPVMEDGEPVYEYDEDGNLIPLTNGDGEQIYIVDPDTGEEVGAYQVVPVLEDQITEFDCIEQVDEGETPLIATSASMQPVLGVSGWGDQLAEDAEITALIADEAASVANAINQHFWTDTSGAHVTDAEQDDWATEYAKPNHGELSNPTDARPWHNQLMNSLGTLLRTGLNNLVSITRSAIAFFDGSGNESSNIVAQFGSSGAQIGKTDDEHILLNSNGVFIANGQYEESAFTGLYAELAKRKVAETVGWVDIYGGSMDIISGELQDSNVWLNSITTEAGDLMLLPHNNKGVIIGVDPLYYDVYDFTIDPDTHQREYGYNGHGNWLKVHGDIASSSYSLETVGAAVDAIPGVWYGTCDTTASTAEKAVTCTGFSLKKGALIGILFTTANTAATPTLNVNSTTAKDIYVGNATPSSTTNVLKWSANTMLYFVYDGSAYRYMGAVAAASVEQPDGAGAWWGTSSTAASTRDKASTIANFKLTRGAVVAVKFTYANTYTGNSTRLNINSTGAKVIYYKGTATSSTHLITWEAGAICLFVYSGSYWYFLGSDRDFPPAPYTSDPAMDGTASAGSSDAYARGDHVHPTDTSRAAASHTHTESDITDLGSYAAASHSHGSLNQYGEVTDGVTPAPGDFILIADDSDTGALAAGPEIGSDTTKYLRNDGSWAVPPDTVYTHPTTTAATASAKKVGNDSLGHVVLGDALTASDISFDQGGGHVSSVQSSIEDIAEALDGMASSSHTHGNITNGGDITATAPTVASGDKLIINDESASKITNGPSFGSDTTKYLRNDGSWEVPPGTYTHPSHTAKSSGLYKVTVDSQGHVSDATAVQKSDITALGIPAQDTTYTPYASNPAMDGTASAGSSSDYARGDHVHPTDTSRAAASHTHEQADMTNGAFAWYATSSTAASTAAKVASCTGFTLKAGAVVFVAFTNFNSVNDAITLNVNSTGAKAVYIDGVITDIDWVLSWAAGDVLQFVYNGTAWEYIDGSSSMGWLDHPEFTPASAAAIKVGRDGYGHVVLGSALTAADVGANAVSIIRNTTSGTNIADITIDGTTTKLYAPTSGGGGPSPSSATPQMDGTASAGTSDDYARGDHVHPSDTGKSDVGHTHAASDITSGTLDIANGGTGQSSVSTESTVSTLITAASGTTISAAYFKQWGKLALLQVSFKRTSSWAANAQVDVGTVKTGYRPALLVNGGNANVIAHLNGSGVMRARNMTGAAIATTTQQDIGFTFLLP